MLTPRMALISVVSTLATCPGWAGEVDAKPGTNTTDATAPSPSALAVPLDDPWLSPDVAAPRMEDDQTVRRPQASRGRISTDAPQGRSVPWVRTTLSLAGVVALIMLLAWGYRLGTGASSRLSFARRVRQPGLIEVISRANLAPRQSVCLLRVGPQLVLIGATHDSLRTLSVIEDPELTARLAGQHAQRRSDSHTAEFQRCLETEQKTYRDDDPSEQPGAPQTARLISINQSLSQTARRLRAAAHSA